MIVMFPKEKGPIWIDWNQSTEGGLRVIAATDEDSNPAMAIVDLDAAGEMKQRPSYQPLRAWCTTRLLRMKDGTTQLWRFVATLSAEGLMMKAKPVPSEDYQARVVLWRAVTPTTSF